MFGKKPATLGVHKGQLAPCPKSPNCVSTYADNPKQHMPPIPLAEPAEQALAKLQLIIRDMPNSRIVSVTDNYLHAEFATSLFRFVDDVEFLIDEEKKAIHFRSASRVGYSDFGVNRRRMTEICEKFAGASADARETDR
jgi:uncharacterized protein (DUF1499 family)